MKCIKSFDYERESEDDYYSAYHTSAEFPKSPYDIEFTIKRKRKYVEVKSTSIDKKTFIMLKYEINFMNKYKDDYILFVVTNVKTHFLNTQNSIS